jgi:hypothetical protein
MIKRTNSSKPSPTVWLAGTLIGTGLWLLAAPPAFGQGGLASINGTVLDQSGAVIPGAQVSVANTATGLTQEAVSGSNGAYVLPLLPVGTYNASCTHAGFEAAVQQVTITADQKATVDFSLRVGQTMETVEVSGTAATLQTTSASLSEIITEKPIAELPLNGRDPAQLVLLTPGASDGLKNGTYTRQGYTSFPSETGVSINGGRQGSTYFMLDGGNNMDNYGLLAAPFPNPDATGEFRVISNNFGAQYGYGFSVVSIVTRSGTNEWHGDVFEFLRNDALNARDFFSPTRDILKRNQFGASVGGPIRKDKLFIFGNYQGTRFVHVQNGSSAFIPNNNQLQGNFSDLLKGKTANLCGAGGPANLNYDTGQIFDPATPTAFTCPAGSANAGQQVVVRQPFAGNIVPTARFNPVSLKLETALPRTDNPTGEIFIPGLHSKRSWNEFTIRPDWYASPKNRVSGHAYVNDFDQPFQTGGGDMLISDRSWAVRYQSYVGNWVYTARPDLINNLVIGFARTHAFSQPGLQFSDKSPICLSCVGSKVNENLTAFKPGLFLGTPGFFVGQNTNTINRYNLSITDSLSWVKGKHMIVAGVDILRQGWTEGTDWISIPILDFNGRFSGSWISDFLLGQMDSFEQNAGSVNSVHGTTWAGYVQDTIRLKPNLTLDAGLRWEPYFPFTPTAGRATVYRPGQHSTRFPNAPTGMVFPGDPGVPAAGGTPRDLPLFTPRLGLSWQPKALPNTVVRAAYGMFISPFEMSFYNHTADSAPFSPTFNVNYATTGGPPVPGGTPIPVDNPYSVIAPTNYQSPFPPWNSSTYVPSSSVTFTLPVFIQHSFGADFRAGRLQTWNLSVQREFKHGVFAQVAYIGSEAYYLPTILDANPGIYSPNLALNGLRALTDFSTIYNYEPIGTASYNGLQLSVNKKAGTHLIFGANYTWSKNLDSQSSAAEAFNGSMPDPFNVRFNRGISDLNYPSLFSVNWVYNLPSLTHQNGFVRALLGEWEFSGIWRAQSGNPFSIYGGTDNSASHVGADRADLTGQPFNVRPGSKNQWLQHYFNAAAFQVNAPGTFGNSARNIFQGPGVNDVDLGIYKNFKLTERNSVQFRWEMFNAFNRAIFSTPGNNLNNPAGLGLINSTWGYNAGVGGAEQDLFGWPARIMQFALKFYW